MHRLLVVVALPLVCLGCGTIDPPEPIAYPVPYPARVEVRPETRVIVNQPSPDHTLAPGEWSTPPVQAVSAGILITTARKLDRPTEVVGVIDAHEPSGRQDAAFALIRERASAMGADAVVGVEFHHGEEKDEPTHLSGLAVRYLDPTR
jgi:hypothetical protein